MMKSDALAGKVPAFNKVDPLGRFVSCERGARFPLLGNRGNLGNGPRPYKTNSRSDAWIYCEADNQKLIARGKGRKPGQVLSYTHLFFFDEPTALAAGHRPCGDCLRHVEDGRYQKFKDHWVETFGVDLPGNSIPDQIDRRLKSERLASTHGQPYSAKLGDLPVGTMVMIDGQFHLYWDARVRRWSMDGYGSPRELDPGVEVSVVTPRSIVEVMRSGYVPVPAFGAGG